MHLTRRHFLQSTGALSAYLGGGPLQLLADDTISPLQVTKNKTLVVIFLRGGADGLNLVIPHGDAHYSRLRKGIGINRPGRGDGNAIDLDGMFGLHPRLSAMKPMFDSGLAVAAHAVGYDHNTRSHFEEQDVWETGVIGNTVNSDGWVNRHLATSTGSGSIRAISVGDTLPRMLRGDAPAIAIRGIEDLTLPANRPDQARSIAAALEHAYKVDPTHHQEEARAILGQSAVATLDSIEELQAIAGVPYQPKQPYPNTELARRLMQVARLIKAGIGLEVAEIDYGGWDTHRDQGRGAGGQFGNLAGTLGDAMAAFCTDMEDQMDDVLVMTITDFGRTAAENGTGGTDHGWANCMFLAGGPVMRANEAASKAGQARKVVSDWPGLAPDQLHQGRDLLHTTDFRDVLAEVVRVHLGNSNLETVLPNHTFKNVGLVT